MTEPEDIDMLAAEYVLGTLDRAERAAVEARRRREPALAAAIEAWEQRLAPLGDGVAPLEPPADMLARIERQIERRADDRAEERAEERAGIVAPAAAAGAGAEIVALGARLRRWQRATWITGALAASLALAIGLRETVLQPPPQSFVAAFQKDDSEPAFLLTIDLASRTVTIRPVAAERPENRIYQLWIADPALGPAPRSLGLIEEARAPTRKVLAGFDPTLLRRATFGISVEPPGGSPTGRPTSPALHAKLYPAAP